MKYLIPYLKKYKKESILAPLFKMLEACFDLIGATDRGRSDRCGNCGQGYTLYTDTFRITACDGTAWTYL